MNEAGKKARDALFEEGRNAYWDLRMENFPGIEKKHTDKFWETYNSAWKKYGVEDARSKFVDAWKEKTKLGSIQKTLNTKKWREADAAYRKANRDYIEKGKEFPTKCTLARISTLIRFRKRFETAEKPPFTTS